MDAATRLFQYVERFAPETYRRILHVIRPHSLAAVSRIFQQHLRSSIPDLRVLRPEKVPELCLQFVLAIRRQFPNPGDPFGIQLTCRLTKTGTQGTLDSKHLQASDSTMLYNVDKALKLNFFTNHTQIFELATTHTYASIFIKGYTVDELLDLLPNAGKLERVWPFQKAQNVHGQFKYINMFQFTIVPNRIIYKTFRDLMVALQRLKPDRIVCISDIRYVFQKCGLVSYFFNLIHVAGQQLLFDRDSEYAHLVKFVIKYQCHTGKPLPLTRDGLSKNSERSPIEIFRFEAPKKNYAIECTKIPMKIQPVETSADKIYFGQQFNEGSIADAIQAPKTHFQVQGENEEVFKWYPSANDKRFTAIIENISEDALCDGIPGLSEYGGREVEKNVLEIEIPDSDLVEMLGIFAGLRGWAENCQTKCYFFFHSSYIKPLQQGMSYHKFLRSLFGNNYSLHHSYLHGIHLYCLFVVTLVVALCAYCAHSYSRECDQTFKERVHALRIIYATQCNAKAFAE
ncbi:hypothetical protein JTE90_016336 [Oedothorax gibbosus]|uniref:Uncharacterized protein n=1 Tax=Oedothorax gibbosus TaxID=931172 RepID=A0AAV6TPC5_9ARAC|nr:hypothetical protein JTE90_016336 [Oedothorax gibbosus]